MTVQVEDGSAEVVAPPPPPLPPSQRRPRVREVSSRFMSPSPHSSSSTLGDQTKSPLRNQQQREQRQRRRLELEADDNRPRVREVGSRFMSPSQHSSSSTSGEPSRSPLRNQRERSVSAQRQRRRLEMEADENRPAETHRSLESPFTSTSTNTVKKFHLSRTSSDSAKLFGRSTPLRPDTPTTITSDITASSRIRLNHCPATAATKLLQSSVMSMPETDQLPSISTRFLSERNLNKGNDTSKPTASPFSRSLNSSLYSSETPMFHHPLKGGSVKPGGLSLPPVPKPGTDTRKAKKVCSLQEDVHSLKLLHNHWLQWTFTNAKAEATMQFQKGETERTIYSLGLKISTLYDSVKRKRIELGVLQRMKTLTTILEAQMPYLDTWSAFQEEYSNSLSEAVEALLNASLRLPISGNVRADVREVGEAINSAVKMMEMIFCHVQGFMPKAEEMESLISELARVTGGEKALVEECGDLLSMTYASQVEECSLQSQLIQFSRRCATKFQEDGL
ncbi:hypothetical protein SLEP1_g29195 [Rubroshorea leprosula]|uniref:Protein ENDOSPERM DEFECTIVE 1 n=1 Tax=Rubroshorea leprosula TaxID=152421 RepID=A0AAV5K700_9ROSI|nr:hypothetical protein SLEP1_g29195 [Rubroshorea leprosula]